MLGEVTRLDDLDAPLDEPPREPCSSCHDRVTLTCPIVNVRSRVGSRLDLQVAMCTDTAVHRLERSAHYVNDMLIVG